MKIDILLFNKPYRVLSQFTDKRNQASIDGKSRQTLADFIHQPKFYPAGRLDFLSEGLMVLTDNGALQQRISSPEQKMEKSYWVQVEGCPSKEVLQQLADGIELTDGLTKRAKIQRLKQAPTLWQREPPLAQHRELNSQWLNISIREGRNRQIRRMFACVDHPVLRLVRHKIGNWHLSDLEPGQYKKITVNLPKNISKKW